MSDTPITDRAAYKPAIHTPEFEPQFCHIDKVRHLERVANQLTYRLRVCLVALEQSGYNAALDNKALAAFEAMKK